MSATDVVLWPAPANPADIWLRDGSYESTAPTGPRPPRVDSAPQRAAIVALIRRRLVGLVTGTAAGRRRAAAAVVAACIQYSARDAALGGSPIRVSADYRTFVVIMRDSFGPWVIRGKITDAGVTISQAVF